MTMSGALDVARVRASEFPWTGSGDAIYLNNAGTGPLPERTRRVLDEWSRLRAEPHRIPDTLLFETLDRGRDLVARLIGAETSEIAMSVNTTFGINLAAAALPLGPGDVVIGPDREFPANVYPWMQLARSRGFEYRQVPTSGALVDEDALVGALDDPKVKAVSVSWVSFATGYAVDLERIGEICHERGKYLVVDGIQGIGARAIDVHKCHIDIMACGAQKWLLSPWGSGFTYVRRELVERLDPQVVSWMAVRGSDDFSRLLDYDLTWRPDARRFELVTLPYHDFAAMNASLELFHELGPDAIAERVGSLATRIVNWAQGRDDVRLVTPADASRRAGIVALAPREPQRVSAALKAAGVAHSLREGSIRLSPHFYNTDAEVDRALELLGSA